MIRRLVTSLTLVAGAFAFQAATASSAHAGFTSCVTANDDAYITPFNTPITVTDTQVLDNDTVDPECDSYSHSDLYVNDWTDLIPPSHGTLERIGDSWKYTPDDGFVGTDSFKYKACLHQPEIIIEGEGGGEGDDCQQCDWATVSIDPQGQVTTTTATVLDTVITNSSSSSSTTAATVLAAQLAATGADTTTTLPIAGMLTGSGSIFVAGAAIARRRLKVRKYKK